MGYPYNNIWVNKIQDLMRQIKTARAIKLQQFIKLKRDMDKIPDFLVFENLKSPPPVSQRTSNFLSLTGIQNVAYFSLNHLSNTQSFKNKLQKSKAIIFIYYVDRKQTEGDLLGSLTKIQQNISQILAKTLVFCVGRSQFYSFKFDQKFVSAVKSYKIRVRFGTLEQLSDIGDQMKLIGDNLLKCSVNTLQKNQKINAGIAQQINLMKGSATYTFIWQIEQARQQRMELMQNRIIKIKQNQNTLSKCEFNLRVKHYAACIRRLIKHKLSYNYLVQQMNSISKIIQKMKSYAQHQNTNQTLMNTIQLTLECLERWLDQSEKKIIRYNHEKTEKESQLQIQLKLPKIIIEFGQSFIQFLNQYHQNMKQQHKDLLKENTQIAKLIKQMTQQIGECQIKIKLNQELLRIQDKRKEEIIDEIQIQNNRKDHMVKEVQQNQLKMIEHLKIDKKQLFLLFQSLKQKQKSLQFETRITQEQVEQIYNTLKLQANIPRQEAISKLNGMIDLNTKKKNMRPDIANTIDQINSKLNQLVIVLNNKIHQQKQQQIIQKIKIQIKNKKQKIRSYAIAQEYEVIDTLAQLDFKISKIKFDHAAKLYSLQKQGKDKQQILDKFKEDQVIQQNLIQKINSQFLLANNQEEAHKIDQKFAMKKYEIQKLKQFTSIIENDRKDTAFQLYKIINNNEIWKKEYEQTLNINRQTESKKLLNQIQQASKVFDQQENQQNYERISLIILQYTSKTNQLYKVAKIEQNINEAIQKNNNQLRLMPNYRDEIKNLNDELKNLGSNLTANKTIQFLIEKVLLKDEKGVFYKRMCLHIVNIHQECQSIMLKAKKLDDLNSNLLHFDTYKKHVGQIGEQDDMLIFNFLLETNQKLMLGQSWNQPIFGDDILPQSKQFEKLNLEILNDLMKIGKLLQTFYTQQSINFKDVLKNRIRNLTTLQQIQKNNAEIL